MPMMRTRSVLIAAFAGLALTAFSTIASSSNAQVGEQRPPSLCQSLLCARTSWQSLPLKRMCALRV